MTHAELLRNHADLATREGGMYYSGEYLSQIAKTAESLEAENAKLRELVDELYPLADYGAMDASELDRAHDLMRELGIEVVE